MRPRYSGGVDWVAALAAAPAGPRGVLAPGHDISPYLVAADLMITDHSSAGFEFLLRDRPIVRIHRPELIRDANIHPTTSSCSPSVSDIASSAWTRRSRAVERGLAIAGRARRDAARRRRGSLLSARRRHRAAPSHSSTKRSSSTLPALGRLVDAQEVIVPSVSVIMPAYNVEPYIGDGDPLGARADATPTSSSIVVDDGSKDGTAEVVEALAREDARIQLVQQRNRGLAGARNTALRAARGEFFALLDSDDLWEPDFLAEQIADPRARGPRSTSSPATAGASAAHRHGQLARPCPDPRPAPDLASIIGDEWCGVHHVGLPPARLHDHRRRSTKTMRSNEDYDFWLRAAVAGFRFARNDRPLGHYRVRTDSLSASDVRMLRGILHVYTQAAPGDRRSAARDGDPRCGRSPVRDRMARRRSARSRSRSPTSRPRASTWARCTRAAAAPRSALARLLARWAPHMLKRVIRFERARADAPSTGRCCPDAMKRSLHRHRDLQPRRRPARDARQPRRAAPGRRRGKSSSSTTTRPTTRAQVVEDARHRAFPRRCATSSNASRGAARR